MGGEIDCLEGSVASPSYRGSGLIVPATYPKSADKHEKTGTGSSITKVLEDSKVTRLIVTRTGFCEVAITPALGRGLQQRTLMRVGTDATAGFEAGDHLFSQAVGIFRLPAEPLRVRPQEHEQNVPSGRCRGLIFVSS